MNAIPLVEFKRVSKNFGPVRALTDISFGVARGEFVFIVGPSGSGKTTLLRLLLGEVTPSAGQIIFDGQDVTNLGEEELQKISFSRAFSFQREQITGYR